MERDASGHARHDLTLGGVGHTEARERAEGRGRGGRETRPRKLGREVDRKVARPLGKGALGILRQHDARQCVPKTNAVETTGRWHGCKLLEARTVHLAPTCHERCAAASTGIESAAAGSAAAQSDPADPPFAIGAVRLVLRAVHCHVLSATVRSASALCGPVRHCSSTAYGRAHCRKHVATQMHYVAIRDKTVQHSTPRCNTVQHGASR